MKQRHYAVYVETVWNGKDYSRACSSVYLCDIDGCNTGQMITLTMCGGKDEGQAVMLRKATLAALNRVLAEMVEAGSEIMLYINCGYIRNALMQKQYQRWQQNGWKTEQGTDLPEGSDQWQKLLALFGTMTVLPIQKGVWEQDIEIAKMLLQTAELGAMTPEERKNA